MVTNVQLNKDVYQRYANHCKESTLSFEAVGGHPDQWFVDRDTIPGCVKKATTHNEAMFYWWVNHHRKGSPIRLVSLNNRRIPQRGLKCIAMEQFKTETPDVVFPSDAVFEKLYCFIPMCKTLGVPQTRDEGRMYHVEMENLLLSFKRPCVMDIKMGTRMYGDHATQEKRQRMIAKSRLSTAHLHGIRLTAWKIWNATLERTEIMTREEASQLMSLNDFKHAFERYLNAVGEGRDRRTLALLFKEKLYTLKLWFKTQCIANFYSSSLLFLYDADNPLNVDVRMIDFAHVTFNPSEKDTGYIQGLSALVDLLTAYIDSQPDEESISHIDTKCLFL